MNLKTVLSLLIVAAGYIANAEFNQIIERTEMDQRNTAGQVSEAASTEAGIQNYLSERSQGSRLTY